MIRPYESVKLPLIVELDIAGGIERIGFARGTTVIYDLYPGTGE